MIQTLEMRIIGKNAVRPFAALAALALGACSGGGTGVAPLGAEAPGPIPTVDAATRSTPVVVGRPSRVFVFAGFGKKCEVLPEPQITVTTPPSRGEVTLRPGQATTIMSSLEGTCVGKRAMGTGIYYTAKAGGPGTDTFVVTAKLSSGETATRTFEVSIVE